MTDFSWGRMDEVARIEASRAAVWQPLGVAA